jgi:hypothetical protein
VKRFIKIGAIIGFFVPIFWGIVSLILFTAPQSRFADIYWIVVHFTCPPWSISPVSSPILGNTLATPFLNAALYAGIALIMYAVLPKSRTK